LVFKWDEFIFCSSQEHRALQNESAEIVSQELGQSMSQFISKLKAFVRNDTELQAILRGERGNAFIRGQLWLVFPSIRERERHENEQRREEEDERISYVVEKMEIPRGQDGWTIEGVLSIELADRSRLFRPGSFLPYSY